MLGAKEVNGARFQTETLPKIDGRPVYLWRAVDAEGEVLDVLVQTRPD
jgi:transposase-like protein